MFYQRVAFFLAATALSHLGCATAIPRSNGTIIPDQWRESVEMTWGYSQKRADAIMPDSTLDGYKNWALDQIIDGDGTINVCMRWGANTTLTQETRQQIETMYKKQYERWFRWLPGWDNYPFKKFNLKVTGWAVSDSGLFEGPADGIKVYAGLSDKAGDPICDPGCSRNLHLDGNYSDCAEGFDGRFHQFFFIDPSWGDYNMGAASGPGVDVSFFGWKTVGSKLGDWSILLHELGHTFGFPDYISDGKANQNECSTIWVPPAAPNEWVMLPTDYGAHVPEVTEFEGWMIRHWWSRFSRMRGWQRDDMVFMPSPACEWKL